MDNTVTLYHGSKSGIKGAIAPYSRKFCDFGRAFYMGTDKLQPLTLVCNYPKSKFYTLELDLKGLELLNIEPDIDWALFVAFNRGKMEGVKGSHIYEKYGNLSKGCDVISGYIANDRMFVVLDRFFAGEITDVALVHSLSALKLGKQYVAVTEKACSQIRIIEEKEITQSEREKLIEISENNRSEGVSKANEICRRYRREGKFFDEILEGGI